MTPSSESAPAPEVPEPEAPHPEAPQEKAGSPSGAWSPPVSTFEIGLVALLVIGAAVLAGKLIFQPGPSASEGAPNSMLRLESLLEAGKGQGVLALAGSVALASLLGLVFGFRATLAQLPRALRSRERGPLSVGFFLLALGISIVVGSVFVAGVPKPRLVTSEAEVPIPAGLARLSVMANAERVDLSWEATPEGPEPPTLDEGFLPRAKLHWGLGSGELEVVGGRRLPVFLDGVALADGSRTELWTGSELRVGAWKGKIEGGGWVELGGAMAFGQILALLCLLLGARAFLIPSQGGARVGPSLLQASGLHLQGWRRELLRGAVAYFAFVPLYLLATVLTQWLSTQLGIPVQNHSLIRALERETGSRLGLTVFVLAVVLAPLMEEFLYRGLALAGFTRVLGPVGGLCASALLFAVAHQSFTSLLPMFALGLLFGALRMTSPSRSTLGSITAHALHNGVTLGLVFAIQAS